MAGIFVSISDVASERKGQEKFVHLIKRIMKEIVLDIEERKYKFFLDLIKNFDFVSVRKNTNKKELLMSIAKGMQEAKLAANGKLKGRSAKSFLNEF